ncbi:hypothetical protein W97_07200 [Coniosporium apollinis CBS 100218]|uniref:Calcipressin n=1 Tax=Coniosporium apollinis (strain CBS 100218) TaxID=1168221 RepID=R7Z1M3_CONA1|nr:uncharacterized protein W97_07200 [Coniosporium apollinis CBS 100218]EON68052.1 hypothetical protein W97_07200 [Coniosporium apollinis CBS 100218]
MSSDLSSPTLSRSSSRSSKGRRTPLSLDLSDLPPLVTPSPPSNTLLITNLQNPAIFSTPNLITIRDLINQHAPIHTWAPLKSFRRIVTSFWSTEDATTIRKLLDGEAIMGDRIRVYFGQPTPLDAPDQHLHLPKSDKLFFISPPPSPPHGWEMRNEDPPNKDVHAEDLASALAKLHARPDVPSPTSPEGNPETKLSKNGSRNRSGSLIVWDPQEHGRSPDLPAISVEDTTHSPVELSPVLEGKPITHTMRPPVELMEE